MSIWKFVLCLIPLVALSGIAAGADVNALRTKADEETTAKLADAGLNANYFCPGGNGAFFLSGATGWCDFKLDGTTYYRDLAFDSWRTKVVSLIPYVTEKVAAYKLDSPADGVDYFAFQYDSPTKVADVWTSEFGVFYPTLFCRATVYKNRSEK